MAKSQGRAGKTAPIPTRGPLQAELQYVSVSPGCDEPEGAQPGRCVGVFLALCAWPLWAVDQEGLLVEARWIQLNCSPTPGSWELGAGGTWELEIAGDLWEV